MISRKRFRQFRGIFLQVIARRMDESGKVNVLLHWHPEDVYVNAHVLNYTYYSNDRQMCLFRCVDIVHIHMYDFLYKSEATRILLFSNVWYTWVIAIHLQAHLVLLCLYTCMHTCTLSMCSYPTIAVLKAIWFLENWCCWLKCLNIILNIFE